MANTPNYPEPGPTDRIPTPQERIDLAAQYRRTNDKDNPIPAFRVDTNISLSNRLVKAAENIALTNTRILANLGQMNTMFSQFNKDQQIVNQVKKEASQISVEGAASTVAGRQLIDPVADLTDAQRIRALSEAKRLRGLSFEQQVRGLEATGMGKLQRGSGEIQIGEERFASKHLRSALDRVTGTIKESKDPEVEKLASSLEQRMMQWSMGQSNTMKEKLQAKGLEVWDFANPANLMHNVGSMMTGHHLPGGGRRRMPITVPTTVAGEVGAEGVSVGGLLGASGTAEKLMSGAGIGGLMARAGLGLIPGVGQIALAAMLLPSIAHHIPGVNKLLGARQDVINLQNRGALTGEGFGGGLAAFREARDLRGGVIGSQFHGLLHPFDPITNQIAEEIVTSVRTQGLTGRQGRAFEHQAASLYRDLRLPIDQTTQLLADAVRQGGESLGQIGKEMHTFDDAAHSLQMNINDYATSIAAASKTLRDAGAGAQATQFAQSLIASLPRSMRNQEGITQAQTSMQSAAPFITAQTGIPFWQQGLAQNIPAVRAAYQNVLQQQFRLMPGRTAEEKAAAASQFSPVFRGMPVQSILQMIDRIRHGRGPGSISVLEQARHSYNRGLTRSSQPLRVTAGALLTAGKDYALQNGLTEAQWNRLQNAEPNKMVNLPGFRDLSRMPTSQLRALRQQALNQVRGVLTEQQQKELTSHLGDRGFSFDKALRRMEAGRGRFTGGASVDVNGVTITLKGKAAKHFQLNQGNKERAYRGLAPMNSSFPTEDSRLDTGF